MPEFDSTVEYRDMVGFPGYKVGNDGTVWSCFKQRGVKGREMGNEWGLSNEWRQLKLSTLIKLPYQKASMRRDGKPHGRTVHTLVLEAFVGPCPAGMWARHLDGNPRNNSIGNLEWNTPSINLRDRKPHGWCSDGELNSCAKLTEAQVLEIRARRTVGEKLIVLAKEYGVTFQTISDLARGKRWKYLLPRAELLDEKTHKGKRPK